MQDYRFWLECLAKGAAITVLDDVLYVQRKHNNRETNRIISKKRMERARKYKELQRYGLESAGLRLSENEMNTVNTYWSENQKEMLSHEELAEFYRVLNTIVCQSRELKLDNADEIAVLCRQLLIAKMMANETMIWSERV
jgi:hypothetical protein